MLRFLFWLLVIAAVVLVLDGTVPLPGVPDEGVVFTTTPLVATCGASGCIVVYDLEVTNDGRSAQDGVRVRLRSEAVASPVIPPTVRRASEVTTATAANDRQGVDAVQLGKLEPEERVALVFGLRAASREAVPGWDRVLVGVEPTAGSARPGDVGAITTGRLVHVAGRVVHRVVQAVRRAISSS